MVRFVHLRFAALLAAALLPLILTSADAQYAPALTTVGPRSLSAIRFRFMADGAVRGGFGLSGKRLLFGTENGSFYAIDQKSGRLLWRTSAGSPVLSTPAIVGNRAYFTTWDNVLHAADVATGRQLWRRDLGRTLGQNDYWEYYVSSPVLSGGRLYVGSGSGRVFAIDPGSGSIAWSVDLGTRVRTTPLVAGDRLIVGTMAGHVVALHRKNGIKLWDFATVGAGHDFSFKQNDTRSVVTQPLAVGDTVVVAGGRDGNIYGLDLGTGAKRWQETHDGSSWILGLAAGSSAFYSGSGSAFIVQAADAATGKELWRTPTANAMFGGLAKAGDVLVSNGSNGALFAFDAATGAQLWRLRLPDMSFASPLVAPGVVFTGADDGTVEAFDTSTAAAPVLARYVYGFTDEPPASAFWFKPDVLGAIRGGLVASGYAELGTEEIAKTLATPAEPNRRRIVVLADTRLPEGVGAAELRAFLDSGEVLVLLGVDPLIYGFDDLGRPIVIDESRETSAFGIKPTDKERDYGYNVSTFTAAAKPLGLAGRFVAIGSDRPESVSTVLATDRSGMATAWIKRFRNGGLLIELPLPRTRATDLSRYVNAIDLAVVQNGDARPY